MEHKLHVLVRMDIDQNSAVLVITGCLTTDNYLALVPIIRRAQSLVSGLGVVVDLSDAKHVDADVADLLLSAVPAQVNGAGLRVNADLKLPESFPVCGDLSQRVPGSELAA